MALVTLNAGKWPSGKFPQDWGSGNRDFAHVAPEEYGQETLFEEWQWWAVTHYKPYPGATAFQSVFAMCRAVPVPDAYGAALSIFRSGFRKEQDGRFLYVDTRCRLVTNDEIKYPLYR